MLLVRNKNREGADDLVAVELLVLMPWSLLHNPVTMLDSYSVLLTSYLSIFYLASHSSNRVNIYLRFLCREVAQNTPPLAETGLHKSAGQTA